MRREWTTRLRFRFLESKLARRYRRLQKVQARDARASSRQLLHDVADVLLKLQVVTERVEDTLLEAEQDNDS